MDWIIFGTGPMTTSEPFKEAFKESQKEAQQATGLLPFDMNSLPEHASETVDKPNDEGMVEPGVKMMIMLYEDGTFETFSPR